jgi:hypothetical protein
MFQRASPASTCRSCQTLGPANAMHLQVQAHFMRRTLLVLSIAMLAACAAPKPVEPDPSSPPQSAECKALGRPLPGQKFVAMPVEARRNWQGGWVQFKFDVSAGQVGNVEVLASSPKGYFDRVVQDWAPTLRFEPSRSANGCVSLYKFAHDH